MVQKVSTDDYVAVLEHMGRYCHYIDGGYPELWASCFTEDGVFEGPATPGPVTGRSALKDFAAATYDSSKGGKIRHFVGNMFCDYGVDRDEIRASFYNYVTLWFDGGQGSVMALCSAILKRNGDGWLLKSNIYTAA